MQITDVRIRKTVKDGKMRGMASITFDNAFVVHDIKIIEGDRGLFIAMPSRKAKDGTFRDIAHPINSDTRGMIQDCVLRAFEQTPEPEEDAGAADADGGIYGDGIEPEPAW